ncbi:hypothetical protein [Cupriavidus sp. CuC1]|uniref:hypothetical protein n=1 Tax=Cupriavidus sp. CuC1 TaxID=3373131 RepID=UPI0037D288A5
MLNHPAFWAVIFFLLPLAQSLGDWHSRIAAWACLSAAMLLCSYALVNWLRLPRGYKWTWAALRNLAWGSKVSLSDAARLAYEEARVNNTIWARAAERLAVNRTPGGILDYIAGYFACEVQLYGRRPPSQRLEAVDRFQAKHGTFRGGARNLYLRDQSKTEFSDLQVSRKDLKTVRELMRNALKADEPI